MERVPTINQVRGVFTASLQDLLVFYCGSGIIEIYAIRAKESHYHASGTLSGYDAMRRLVGNHNIVLTNEFADSIKVGDVVHAFGHPCLLINKGGGDIEKPSHKEFLEVVALHKELEAIRAEEEQQERQRQQVVALRQLALEKAERERDMAETRRNEAEAREKQEQSKRTKDEKARLKRERAAQAPNEGQEANLVTVAYRLAEQKRVEREQRDIKR